MIAVNSTSRMEVRTFNFVSRRSYLKAGLLAQNDLAADKLKAVRLKLENTPSHGTMI